MSGSGRACVIPNGVAEWTEYQTPDGTVYPLVIPSRRGRWILTETGWGSPPVEHVTQRSPLQHGQSLLASWLRPRTVQVAIRQDFCSRNDYWAGRQELVNALRLDVWHFLSDTVTPGILRRVLPNGSLRELDVYLSQGPTFDAPDQRRWDSWGIQEVLRWIAYDPIIRDPVDRSYDLNVLSNTIVTYDGTWQERPTVTMTGPITNPGLVNSTTGETLGFTTVVVAGTSLVISLGSDPVTIVDSLGVDRIGDLDSTSHLASWHLAPHPEAANGQNTLLFSGSGTSGATACVLNYHDKYWGI